jgi:Cyclin, C-terminal domain
VKINRFYLKAAKADEIVDELARYLAVVILLDHDRLAFKASTLAASLVILACLAAGHEESSHVVIEVLSFVSYHKEENKKDREKRVLGNGYK